MTHVQHLELPFPSGSSHTGSKQATSDRSKLHGEDSIKFQRKFNLEETKHGSVEAEMMRGFNTRKQKCMRHKFGTAEGRHFGSNETRCDSFAKEEFEEQK